MVASFEPEAYFWFLHPLFERLAQDHGKYIDLYEGCAFTPEELHLFEDFLADAEVLVRQQELRFRVHVGTQTHPIEKELFIEVGRESYLGFLASLRSAVQSCAEGAKPLCFYGD
ncbi:MAG: hypothetical protein KDA84_05585 [Planctomycetaceae bacterium]|nr:hypothetical protein [Planctomycetaceae bacterium]